MGGGVALAAAAAVAVAWGRPEAWPAALPFLLLWALSPAVARWISLPRSTAPTRPLSAADARALRLDRAADVALLHDVRRPRRPRTAARQLPGDAEPGRRASHVAHEHRALSAVDGGRARFRLDRHARHRRAARGHARDDERASSVSAATSTTGTTRSTATSARPEVRVVGRQRQSRRPSHRARARLRGDDRAPAPRSVRARRDRGRRAARPPVGRRGGRRSAPRPGRPAGAWTRRSTPSRRGPGVPARLGRSGPHGWRRCRHALAR